MKRSWMVEMERGGGEIGSEKDGEGKVGERSKGYLHRVVFFPGAFCSNRLSNGSAG